MSIDAIEHIRSDRGKKAFKKALDDELNNHISAILRILEGREDISEANYVFTLAVTPDGSDLSFEKYESPETINNIKRILWRD